MNNFYIAGFKNKVLVMERNREFKKAKFYPKTKNLKKLKPFLLIRN